MFYGYAHLQYIVSIHAPVRVRRPERAVNPPGRGFNSRTREGATRDVFIVPQKDTVSIHAPVRVRLGELKAIIDGKEFQFTHP